MNERINEDLVFLRSISDALCIVNKDLNVVFRNDSFVELVKKVNPDNATKIIGVNIFDIIPEFSSLMPTYLDMFSSKEEQITEEFTASELSLKIIRRPVVRKGKEYIFTQVLDKTEKKMLEAERDKLMHDLLLKNEELETANLSLKKLFRIMAHDLRNCMNGILGFARILRDNTYSDEEIKEYSGHIVTSAKAGFDIIEDVSEWSQLQAGSIRFEPKEVNVVNLLGDAIEFSQALSAKKNITIHYDTPTNIILNADSIMLKRVLQNLITNAIKFTNNGGSITLSTQETDEVVQICIKDTGVGMPQEKIGKLFKIGETVSSTGTAREKGTGLGLILVKEFIKRHDGKIWCESELGKGTTFCFTLPKNIEGVD